MQRGLNTDDLQGSTVFSWQNSLSTYKQKLRAVF